MLNNHTPPQTDDLENETAVWDRLRADIEDGRRSRDVYRAAQRGEASDSVYLEYDEQELSAAMQASEHDAPGGSQREHEFSDLEERISEAEVPLDDESLLEMESHVQADESPVVRSSQPPALPTPPVSAQGADVEADAGVHRDATSQVDAADEADTQQRISYFEQAQAEAYQQSPIAAFAEEHAAALAKAQGQSRYEQAWAEWDRQFEQIGQAPALASASAVELPVKRSRLLVPGIALVALVGLGAASYQLVIAPGEPEATPAAPQAPEPAAAAAEEQVAGDTAQAADDEAVQRAADEAIARAEQAARAAGGDQAEPSTAAPRPEQARVAPVADEESPEARRERIREEKRLARREARHRRREEKRLAELAELRAAREGGSTKLSAPAADAPAEEVEASDDAEGETVIEPEPVKKPKKKAAAKKGSQDDDDPLAGIE